MTRPTPEPRERTGHGAGLALAAQSRLVEVGIRLRYVAAVCGVSAACEVRVDVGSLPLGGVDGSSIHVVEARLRLQDPDDGAFLAEILGLPAVARRTTVDDWAWRGWLVGDGVQDVLLSVTLTSASDGVARQSQRRGPV